ncbi:MAG: hypothetical protein ABWZ75_07105 [Novosphingobium sp.]
MGNHALGLAGIDEGKAGALLPNNLDRTKRADRFGMLHLGLARLVLGLVVALIVAAALVPIRTAHDESGTALTAMLTSQKTTNTGKHLANGAPAPKTYPPIHGFVRTEADLALYDIAITRMSRGENYYNFIVAEQRAIGYPVTPALTFRLPTLAAFSAFVTPRLLPLFSFGLLLGTVAAWWRRLAEEPRMQHLRVTTAALLFAGGSLAINPYYLVLHEVWAGLLVALSLGLHRMSGEPGGNRWVGSLVAAALALSIREHALPFVLLMGAAAYYRRQWREAGAWTLLILVFLALFSAHILVLGDQALPNERVGPGWMELRGLSGWLSNITMPSMLRLLPHWIAGPTVVLMLVGWAGWRSNLGALVTLLQLGYALAFAIAGRWDNFYWGLIVSPVLFIGLALAPQALRSLFASAFPASSEQFTLAK